MSREGEVARLLERIRALALDLEQLPAHPLTRAALEQHVVGDDDRGAALDLEGPEGEKWVERYEAAAEMKVGDTFVYDGWTFQVVAVAVRQYGTNAPLVLRCVPV